MDGIGENPESMGFDMPLLMGQQSHIFGGYNQDGPAVSSALPGPVFQDEPAVGGNEDNNDAKRRRIARVGDFSP